MTVRYERCAEDDLRDILRRSRHADPVRFTRLLRLRIAALALYPDSGHLLGDAAVREWRLHGTPYVVLYQTRATGIDILRVLDHAWQPETAPAGGNPV